MAENVLELRVHGVSNTPPADLLGVPSGPGRPQPEQPDLVAGDTTTGFYRASGTGPSDPLVVEAYSWGQLTSGMRTAGLRATKDIQRALWTLVLPFSLVNVALHARPDIPADPARETWWSRAGIGGWLVRLMCLSLTATFALAATGVGVDLFAWQCVGTCLDQVRGPWGFLAAGWWSQSTRPLAVGLLLPVLVMLLVWRIAQRSYRYEASLPAGVEAPAVRAAVNPLQQPGYWRGADQVRRLGTVHLATGLAVAAAVPLGVLLYLDRSTGVSRGIGWIVMGLLAAAVLLAAVSLAHPDLAHRQPAAPSGQDPWLHRFGRPLRRPVLPLALLGLTGTVALLLYGAGVEDGLMEFRPPRDCANSPTPDACREDRSLPGYDWVIAWLATGQLLLLFALAGIGRTGRRALLVPVAAAAALVQAYGTGDRWAGDWRPAALIIGLTAVLTLILPRSRSLRAQHVEDPYARVVWGGRAPAVLAGLGWALGMAYSAGVLYGATDALNGNATPTGKTSIAPPVPLLWSAFGLVVAVAVLVVTGLLVLARWSRLQRKSLADVLAEDQFTPAAGAKLSPHERQRAGDVARAYGLHRLVERTGLRTLGVLALLGALVASVGAAAAVAGAVPPLPVTEAARDGQPGGLGDNRFLLALFKGAVDVGGSLAALLLVLIALIGFLIYRNETFRRSFGVVWDIVTFWPRSAHPFGPPCYAELVVPQLQTRSAGLLHLPPDDERRVDGLILGGHSQGAVLCVAAILQMPESIRQRIWLLTFGCQLNRLYGRVFPAQLGPARLRSLSAALTTPGEPPLVRWTNVWRETDPLGYPVRAADPEPWLHEVRLDDPESLHPPGGEVNDPPIRGHGDYPADRTYQRLRNDAAAHLPTQQPAHTGGDGVA